eukprot:11789837-Ditylum_brightwellii.AAC.1
MKPNAYLCNNTTISAMGLRNILELVTISGTTTSLSFHRWLLSVKTSDKSTYIFSAVEKDPNNMYYFVNKKALCEKAEAWINNLPETLVTRFLVDDMDSVTTDNNPTHSYQVIPSDNMDDAVSAYNSILVGDMFINGYVSGDEPKVIEIVEEDVLKRCWKAPPRSVYLNTATGTTHYSTVSGITENNSPAKSTVTVHKEKEWKALVERTAAPEKAAE